MFSRIVDKTLKRVGISGTNRNGNCLIGWEEIEILWMTPARQIDILQTDTAKRRLEFPLRRQIDEIGAAGWN